MALPAKTPPVEDEEIDPEHPQYAHGMEAGLQAAGTLANLPRTAPDVAMGPTGMQGGAQTIPGLNRRSPTDPISPGTAFGRVPLTAAGPTPAVGGTQAVLPPKIEPPLPRKRNQSAVPQPDPANFFRRK